MSIIRRIKISKLTGKELSEYDKKTIKEFNKIFDNTYTRIFPQSNILNIFDKNDYALISLYKNGFGLWGIVNDFDFKNQCNTQDYIDLFQYKYNINTYINFTWHGNLALEWLNDLNDKFIHQQS